MMHCFSLQYSTVGPNLGSKDGGNFSRENYVIEYDFNSDEPLNFDGLTCCKA